MAASLDRINPRTRVAKFFIDTDSQADIDLLPTIKDSGKENLATVHGCAMGSVAYVINEDKYYFQLNGDNLWVKKERSSGGGVDPGDYEWADEGDIDKLFP